MALENKFNVFRRNENISRLPLGSVANENINDPSELLPSSVANETSNNPSENKYNPIVSEQELQEIRKVLQTDKINLVASDDETYSSKYPENDRIMYIRGDASEVFGELFKGMPAHVVAVQYASATQNISKTFPEIQKAINEHDMVAKENEQPTLDRLCGYIAEKAQEVSKPFQMLQTETVSPASTASKNLTLSKLKNKHHRSTKRISNIMKLDLDFLKEREAAAAAGGGHAQKGGNAEWKDANDAEIDDMVEKFYKTIVDHPDNYIGWLKFYNSFAGVQRDPREPSAAPETFSFMREHKEEFKRQIKETIVSFRDKVASKATEPSYTNLERFLFLYVNLLGSGKHTKNPRLYTVLINSLVFGQDYKVKGRAFEQGDKLTEEQQEQHVLWQVGGGGKGTKALSGMPTGLIREGGIQQGHVLLNPFTSFLMQPPSFINTLNADVESIPITYNEVSGEEKSRFMTRDEQKLLVIAALIRVVNEIMAKEEKKSLVEYYSLMLCLTDDEVIPNYFEVRSDYKFYNSLAIENISQLLRMDLCYNMFHVVNADADATVEVVEIFKKKAAAATAAAAAAKFDKEAKYRILLKKRVDLARAEKEAAAAVKAPAAVNNPEKRKVTETRKLLDEAQTLFTEAKDLHNRLQTEAENREEKYKSMIGLSREHISTVPAIIHNKDSACFEDVIKIMFETLLDWSNDDGEYPAFNRDEKKDKTQTEDDFNKNLDSLFIANYTYPDVTNANPILEESAAKGACGVKINGPSVKNNIAARQQFTPYITDKEHKLMAILSHLVYSSTKMIKTYFKPNHSVKYLESYDEDKLWDLKKANCTSLKHRLHAFYEIKEPYNGKRKVGEINIYVAFRGSHTDDDWQNIDYSIMKDKAVFFDKRVKELTDAIVKVQKKLSDKIAEEIKAQDAVYNVQIYSCGHSLGGFLALMAAYKSLSSGFVQTLVKKKTSDATEVRFVYDKNHKYIIPVVFNPFCGYGHYTMFSIRCIPLGFVYRVYAKAEQGVTLTHDAASSGLNSARESMQLTFISILNTCTYFDKSRGRWLPSATGLAQLGVLAESPPLLVAAALSKIWAMKDVKKLATEAHLMHNFIGNYWLIITLEENYIEKSIIDNGYKIVTYTNNKYENKIDQFEIKEFSEFTSAVKPAIAQDGGKRRTLRKNRNKRNTYKMRR